MVKQKTVFIIDDDESIRSSLCWLLESVGLQAQAFESAATFTQSFFQYESNMRSGCIVSDIRMQGMSGLELQVQLRERHVHLPIIFISGHGDIAMAVQAMKAGAADFFTKPINDQALIECIQRILLQEDELDEQRVQLEHIKALINALTRREREVLDKVVEGKSNKLIASELNVSNKTVEAHRAKMMDKMSARTIADLVRMVVRIEYPLPKKRVSEI